jgi:Chaperone of endosialidase
MDERSRGLWELRPVTFRYKQDPSQRQYGLIAEEVAKVYPELVVRGDKGEIESVQYRELIPLVINEMQQQRTEIRYQRAALAELSAQNAALESRLQRLERASSR